MNLAILFSYHIQPEVCRSRLALLRRLQPDVPIWGLYSGSPERAEEFSSLHPLLDHAWAHPPAPPAWMWRHYDKVIAHWHHQAGRSLPWSHLLIHAWDLLLLQPVAHWVPHLEAHQVLVPGLRRLEQMDEEVTDPLHPPQRPGNWSWLRQEPEPFQAFCRYLLSLFGRLPTLYCEVSPFAVLSREFCDQYSRVVEPIPGFNEYRFPTLVQPLGFDFAATDHLGPSLWKHFNAEKIAIPPDLIERECRLPEGARLFHPVYQSWETLP